MPQSRNKPGYGGRLLLAPIIVACLILAAMPLSGSRSAAEAAQMIPAPAVDEPAPQGAAFEVAVLAGGCFWGVQGVFQHVDGITAAVSGYAGGARDTAHYEAVSTGTTGHAEAVQVTFDRHRISYGQVLQIYFSVVHDPTELNRQGPDAGTQYRSAIFPTDPEQARVAEAYIVQLNEAHAFSDPIVTKVEMGREFYPAEAYHQNYLTLHPDESYIAINDLPKIANLEHLFPQFYRAAPVLAGAGRPKS
jgi:peptide-methionine (S)-S-oxide reductase